MKTDKSIQGLEFPSPNLEESQRREFRKVMGLWFPIARRYASHWGFGNKHAGTWEEVHWWYSERTHIGIFAAAVWMAGGVALEEYVSPKVRGDGVRYTGRTDLCFCLPGRDYVAEAKHVRAKLPLGLEAECDVMPILDALRNACGNADAAKEQGYALGLVFVTLEFSGANATASEVTNSIERWVEAIGKNQELRKCLLISWFFPDEGRQLTAEVERTGKIFGTPGTAMFFASAMAFK